MRFLFALVAILALFGGAFALKSEICGLPHSADGNGRMACAAYFPSWSYDAQSSQCVQFIYGGCGGNENRFSSQAECEAKCKE